MSSKPSVQSLRRLAVHISCGDGDRAIEPLTPAPQNTLARIPKIMVT